MKNRILIELSRSMISFNSTQIFVGLQSINASLERSISLLEMYLEKRKFKRNSLIFKWKKKKIFTLSQKLWMSHLSFTSIETWLMGQEMSGLEKRRLTLKDIQSFETKMFNGNEIILILCESESQIEREFIIWPSQFIVDFVIELIGTNSIANGFKFDTVMFVSSVLRCNVSFIDGFCIERFRSINAGDTGTPEKSNGTDGEIGSDISDGGYEWWSLFSGGSKIRFYSMREKFELVSSSFTHNDLFQQTNRIFDWKIDESNWEQHSILF